MTTLVLASASPRRRRLLAELGVPFEVRPTEVDETPAPAEGPEALVARLALDKARAGLAAAPEPEVVVLGADTIVALGEQVLGKPVDGEDARRMLRSLSDTSHRVLTGVAVASRAGGDRNLPARHDESAATLGPATTVAVEVEVTHVDMAPWTDEEIERYVASGEPMDKAGSYAIQEVGDTKVTGYRGSFDNVVGLPLALTRRMLAEVGVQPPEA